MNRTYKDIEYCNTKSRLNKEIANDSTHFDQSQHETFYKKFRSLVNKLKCFESVNKIVVGLSGGPDSAVLLHMMCLYRDKDRGPQITAVHVNHCQRGEKSDRDQAIAKNLAQTHRCDFRAIRLQNIRQSVSEDHLRKLRKGSLLAVAKEMEIERIVLGHHKDDQVETFLFRLIRGADINGLTGMREFQSPFVRPLLGFRRQEILQQAEVCSLQYIEDSSNFFTGPSRNFIRKVVLPAIESKLDPQATDHLTDIVKSLQEMEAYFSEQVSEMIEKVRVADHTYSLSGLRTIPSFLRKKMILRMFQYIMDGKEGSLSRDQIEMIDRWIETTHNPKHLLLPHHKKVEKRDGVLTFQ